jgi:hypothetical protein
MYNAVLKQLNQSNVNYVYCTIVYAIGNAANIAVVFHSSSMKGSAFFCAQRSYADLQLSSLRHLD